MTIHGRGFAALDPTRRREISSLGGLAAHRKGAGHQWTIAEARAAGKKGGVARAIRAAQRAKGKGPAT